MLVVVFWFCLFPSFAYCLAVNFWFLGSFQLFVRLYGAMLFVCVEFVRLVLSKCSVSCCSFLFLCFVFFAGM